MIAETAPIRILQPHEISQREEQGLMVDMTAGNGLKVIDCGDFRHLTDGAAQEREEKYGPGIVPARFYGAASGIVMAGLIAVGAQNGEAAVKEILGDKRPEEAFMRLAAKLAHVGLSQNGLVFNQHSAASNEGNPLSIAPSSEKLTSPLGCKFNAYLGVILGKTDETISVTEARVIRSLTGMTVLPLEDAAQGAAIVREFLPENASVTRSMLNQFRIEPAKSVPTTLLEDSDIEISRIAQVIDLHGYRSDAKAHMGAGIPRFHHTPAIARLAAIMQEFSFVDRRLLNASALILGTTTRLVLSGADSPYALRTEVIPPEYRRAA